MVWTSAPSKRDKQSSVRIDEKSTGIVQVRCNDSNPIDEEWQRGVRLLRRRKRGNQRDSHCYRRMTMRT